MRPLRNIVFSLSWLALIQLAGAFSTAPGEAQLHSIYQFPNETWIENLAVRANGNILVTLVSAPEVWEINPFVTPATAKLLYRFSYLTSALGITEYASDVFAVNVGNLSYHELVAHPGTWSVWSIDLNEGHKNVRKIADIPEAKWLNGNTALAAEPAIVLVADTQAGVIYRVDTMTGAQDIAIDNPYLRANASAPSPLGVNGIHFRPGDTGALYFTNSYNSVIFAKIPIDPSSGAQAGPTEPLLQSTADTTGVLDDFTFDERGNAWIANDAFTGILEVSPHNQVKAVVGGTISSQPVGPTACQFGRSKVDIAKGRLYITTNGGLANPPPQGIVGGRVFALDTALL